MIRVRIIDLSFYKRSFSGIFFFYGYISHFAPLKTKMHPPHPSNRLTLGWEGAFYQLLWVFPGRK